MATKIVKKAPVKTVAKTPVAKTIAITKSPVKKAPVKTVAAPVAPKMVAPIAACPVSAGCGCGCKSGCTCGRFLKKLIVFAVIFTLGWCAAKYCMSHKNQYRGKMMNDISFVNGCLDTTKIKCPLMSEKIALADTDANGCISQEEFAAAKDAMRAERGQKCKCMDDGKCDCGQNHDCDKHEIND